MRSSMKQPDFSYNPLQDNEEHVQDQTSDEVGPFDRYIVPGLALIITTAVSSILVWATVREELLTGNQYIWAKEHAAGLTIANKVLGPVLAFVQLLPLRRAIQLSARKAWKAEPISFATLQCLVGVSSQTMQTGTIGVLFSTALFFLFATQLPTVWFAATLLVDTTTIRSALIPVPVYTPDPDGIYWNQTWTAFAPTNVTFIGNESYSYFPGGTQASTLFNSAATASSNDSTTARLHRKSGTSAPRAGSDAGLPLVSYTYNETGYDTEVQCIYNQSSLWTIQLEEIPIAASDGLPNLYMVQGPLPPGQHVENYAAMAFFDDSSIVALIAGGADITNNIAIAAGASYNDLNLVQCAMQFRPALFQVTAYYQGRNITVVPLSDIANDIDPSSASQPHGRGRLQQAALWEVTRLSQRTGGLYASQLGESLYSNIRRRSNVSDPDSATAAQCLSAVAESFEAVLDDILLAISSAQYMIGPSDARAETPVRVTVSALSVGKPEAIYAVFALNGAIVAIWLAMAARARGWRHTPKWDFCQVTDVVVAASLGGQALGRAFSRMQQTVIDDSKSSPWSGGSREGNVFFPRMWKGQPGMKLRIMLQSQGDKGHALTLGSQELVRMPSPPQSFPYE